MGAVRKLYHGGPEPRANAARNGFPPNHMQAKRLPGYLPWRSPMKFYYSKSHKRGNANIVLNPYRNFYSYYRHRLCPSGNHPLKLFSVAAPRVRSGQGGKAGHEKTSEIRVEPQKYGNKEMKPNARHLSGKVGNGAKSKRDTCEIKRTEEKKAAVTEAKAAVILAKTAGEAKTAPIAENLRPGAPVEQKAAEKSVSPPKAGNAQTKSPGFKKAVVIDGEKMEKRDRIYKDMFTTKEPRTNPEMHAEKKVRAKGGGLSVITSNRPNLGNTDIFLAVSPSAFFAKGKEPKAETVLAAEPIRLPEMRPAGKQRRETDCYHLANRGKRRIVAPKIASGAAAGIF